MAKLILKVAGATLVALGAVSMAHADNHEAAPQDPLTNIQEEQGGVVENLDGGTIDAPVVGPAEPHTPAVQADQDSPLKADVPADNPPTALQETPSSDEGYTNIGGDQGGVIVPKN
ncbi:hypothetical protein [Roseibium sp. RKSG952]|uniref:hypothetical protein n=1 Tax=Roseibium sp. RKSG952 TaxID=2529384 RepID=UPI0012BB5D47|nr:hypothetical protein [Roseibium sp. RKSG952]MTI01071.1 hypothetical protein [Roseibium sp. RKSG952]